LPRSQAPPLWNAKLNLCMRPELDRERTESRSPTEATLPNLTCGMDLSYTDASEPTLSETTFLYQKQLKAFVLQFV